MNDRIAIGNFIDRSAGHGIVFGDVSESSRIPQRAIQFEAWREQMAPFAAEYAERLADGGYQGRDFANLVARNDFEALDETSQLERALSCLEYITRMAQAAPAIAVKVAALAATGWTVVDFLVKSMTG